MKQISAFLLMAAVACGNIITRMEPGEMTDSSDLANGKIRGCYLTNWAQYRPQPGKWTMDKYEAGVCTHIFYAFAKADAQGNVAPTEPNDLTTGYKSLQALKQKDRGLKTILSFGGATFAGFPALVASDASRRGFARKLVDFAKHHGFDGVDIDWEFPSGAQKHGFTELIKAVKAAAGHGFLVTAALSPNAEHAEQIYEFAALKDALDLVTVMAYDFHGSWDKVTGHNAPLKGEGKFTVDYLTQFYKKHFPANKIVLGIPTYGRGWTLASGNPNQGPGSHAPSPSPAFPATRTAGIAAYYEVCQLARKGGKVSFDNKAEVPYVQQGNHWYSYDDGKSVGLKAHYARENGLAGVFVWTLDFDDFENVCNKGKFELLKTIKNVLG
ncbi:unnamed protein product [Bursaphelenchus xylophilus]|uniref:(pine wood nematode) hypothetical protein n=1 Tax=Bursaphelenchus xylophilus TaxID=6326 RepID=A0A1I7RWM2_BURXY|nr:unnamed protein product [Bursaphelenchus xylophilus]CAG9128491.1 unnamed protein product [Bursaphelenchus xylophilus]